MIQQKLLIIQRDLKAPKGQFNKFGNYRYRNAEDILEAVKPLLYTQKCTLTLSDEIVNIGQRYYVKATAKLSDGEEIYEVSSLAREEESKKGMDGSQITGASSSYARKYALNGMFAIDDTKDSDSTNTHDKKEETKVEAKDNNELAKELFEPELDNTILEKIAGAENLMSLTEIWNEIPEQERTLYTNRFSTRKTELKKGRK